MASFTIGSQQQQNPRSPSPPASAYFPMLESADRDRDPNASLRPTDGPMRILRTVQYDIPETSAGSS
ncbi:hypothetical protein GYMLUDRAFT_43441 [Collybiopsis luxurians FD-317 M1]|uniref:Uncharacterized protein n=1 Tax=Collybiopsis luxurians FD-317 M1 TaxID=944289 RepID=A0A0D0CPN2_9AGAR|nr:hypothetical protein GYMLUDRAFT_43441 [Collybiopsis luxurians FD-317 M1]